MARKRKSKSSIRSWLVSDSIARAGRMVVSRFLRRTSGSSGEGYAAAGNDRSTKQWRTSEGTADEDVLFDLQTLRERSRDLVRNSHIGAAIKSTMVTNVVGTGIKLQSRIDRSLLKIKDEEATEWEDNTERRFRLWAETNEADAARKKNFYQIQALAYGSMIESGDSFALMPLIKRPGSLFKLRVRIVEADKVEDPRGINLGSDRDRMRGGVELGDHDEPVAYHFKKPDFTFKRIEAFGKRSGRQNVIHLYKEERPGQSRGVPIMTVIMTKVKQLDRYDEAELAAAVVSSFLTMVISSEDPNALQSQAKGLLEDNSAGDDDPDQDDFDYAMGPATVFQMRDGEKVETFNPGRPNSAHGPFSDTQLRNIGMGVDIPFEILVKMFTSSYSASRAARLEFGKKIGSERQFLTLGFNRPVYLEWLTQEVISGAIIAPGFLEDRNIRAAWSGSQWIGDPAGQLDPTKETAAAIKQIENGLSTRSAEAMKLNGSDFKNNAVRLNAEQKMMPKPDEVIRR